MQLFSIHSHEWLLRPWPRAVLFLLALGLPAFFLSAEVLRVGAADTLATTYEVARLKRAVSLDPDNAKAHRILGSLLCTLEDPHMAEGLEHLRRATELSPNQDINWSALASACELKGDNACADEAFERALRLGPMVPRSEWAAANHFLLTDRMDEALVHFQRLLRLDPGYDWQTFRLCLRATGDPDLVLQKVLAPLGDTTLESVLRQLLERPGRNGFRSPRLDCERCPRVSVSRFVGGTLHRPLAGNGAGPGGSERLAGSRESGYCHETGSG